VARELAISIRGAAKNARAEEDLKVNIEMLLAPALQRLGITSDPRYEVPVRLTRSVSRLTRVGFQDAVYGSLTIEYKRPGVIRTAAGWDRTRRELIGYLEAAATSARQVQRTVRVAGVALDGEQIAFVRPASGEFLGRLGEAPAPPAPDNVLFPGEDTRIHWEVRGPIPIDEFSVASFLAYLRALARKPLTGDELARRFGPAGAIGRETIQVLHAGLQTTGDDPTVATLFAEWDRIFGIVYGSGIQRNQGETERLAAFYQVAGAHEFEKLLFSLHTYYAMVMKLIAAELPSFAGGTLFKSFVEGLAEMDDAHLKDAMTFLEEGALFRALGITNFIEGDFFRWYLRSWSPRLAQCVRSIATALSGFEPATASLSPSVVRDILKDLYQNLVPPTLRRALGEYYTPDWLAEFVLSEAGYNGDVSKTILDPACGSGTFLSLAINQAVQRARFETGRTNEEALLKQITSSISGFDVNPLAVIAARTNYLFALGDLVHRGVTIPVYLCDSVARPTFELVIDGSGYRLATSADTFTVPEELASVSGLEALARVIEQNVSIDAETSHFLDAMTRAGVTVSDAVVGMLTRLYEQIRSLHRAQRDGVWARLIKNAFAPVFAPKVDLVVGNPPWIRWNLLSEDYRERTKPLWKSYGLFSLGGREAQLGGGEKDFSMLFTYACADFYLKAGGKLAFLITQTVFKAKGAGEGFRRFRLGQTGDYLHVDVAHDLVNIKPFATAGNRTAFIVLTKGSPTEYPVRYVQWSRLGTGISEQSELSAVLAKTTRTEIEANPISGAHGAWQTASTERRAELADVFGTSAYSSHRGAGTDPYHVFWLRSIEGVRDDGLVVVQNAAGSGRDRSGTYSAAIEPGLIFPAVKGAHLGRWRLRQHGLLVVPQDPQTRAGFGLSLMQSQYPHTLAYLQHFEPELRARRSQFVRRLMERSAYYAMYGIGDYTFAPHKVVWQRAAARRLRAVPVGPINIAGVGTKPVIPADTTSFIVVASDDEAHYLAALLNSAAVSGAIASFSASGRGFGSPSVIARLSLPRFDPADPNHAVLVGLARQVAVASEARLEDELERVVRQVVTAQGIALRDEAALPAPPSFDDR
jgi:hypothetical protein